MSDMNKDKQELAGGLDNKFRVVIDELKRAAFDGGGRIHWLNQRQFNIHQSGANQLIQLSYSTGDLTITWRYKYFQKEVVHERTFFGARNLSVFEQQNIAFRMVVEMAQVIERHQVAVLGTVHSEEELYARLHRIISAKA